MTENEFARLRALANATLEDPEAAWEAGVKSGLEMNDVELARGVLSLLDEFVGEA